jgi:hypothetical protein
MGLAVIFMQHPPFLMWATFATIACPPSAPLPDGTIVGVPVAAAVFIRVVELDSNGSPTDRVVFEYKIADKD